MNSDKVISSLLLIILFLGSIILVQSYVDTALADENIDDSTKVLITYIPLLLSLVVIVLALYLVYGIAKKG